MKKLLTPSAISLFLLVSTHSECTFAQDGPTSIGGSGQGSEQEAPVVTLNVGVELDGLEAAAREAADGINLIGESIGLLATNPDLSPEQRERFDQVLHRVEQLSESLGMTVEKVPGTLREGMVPLVEAGDALAREIKWIVAVAATAIALIILAAFALFYFFVLAPGAKSVVETARVLDSLAENLNKTAELVETSTRQNAAVARELKALAEHLPGPEDRTLR